MQQNADPRMGWTSASNAEADFLCPGRHLAGRGLPSTGGEYAESGTKIHAALASRDPSQLKVEEKVVYDNCMVMEGKLSQEFFGEHLSKAKVFREERFWVRFRDPNGNEYQHSGQPDCVYRFSTRCLIFEYKTGRADLPEAPTNRQLRDQVCLVKGHFVTLEEVAVCVLQPLVTDDPTPAVYDVAAMQRAEIELFERVAASNNAQSPRHAGEVQCQYCPAKMLCHDYQKFAGGMVIGMNTLLDVPAAQWTAEQRAIYCQKRSIAKKWLAEVDEQMKAGMDADPSFVPGFKLRPGSVREAITNPQECFNRFSKLGGSVEQFLATVAIGKTRLRDAVTKLTGAKGKALEQAVALLTQDIVKVTRTAPSIKAVDGTGEDEELE